MPDDKIIKLRFLDLSQLDTLATFMAGPDQKWAALAKLGITNPQTKYNNTPLAAWVLAMCRENGLPEQLPAHQIADAIEGDVRKWVWFLA